MAEEQLKTNLKQLRAELETRTGLDDDTRQELSAIADTIERVLHDPKADYLEAHASAEDAALRFEARHPAFARILSDVTDALAKLGI